MNARADFGVRVFAVHAVARDVDAVPAGLGKALNHFQQAIAIELNPSNTGGPRPERRQPACSTLRDAITSRDTHYHLGLGERERALTELERAYEDGSWLVALLKVDPLYDELRAEPRFQALLDRLKVPGP